MAVALRHPPRVAPFLPRDPARLLQCRYPQSRRLVGRGVTPFINVIDMVLKPFQKIVDNMSPLHSTPPPHSLPALLSFNSADLRLPHDSPQYADEPVVAPSTALQPSSAVRQLETAIAPGVMELDGVLVGFHALDRTNLSSSYGGVPLISPRVGAPTISQLRLNPSQNFVAVDVDAANHAAAEAVADAYDDNDAEAVALAYDAAEFQAQFDAEDSVDALEREEIEVRVRIRAQQEASDKAHARARARAAADDTRACAAAKAQARESRIQAQVEAFFQAQEQDRAANSAAEAAAVIDADAAAAAKVQAAAAAAAEVQTAVQSLARVSDVHADNNRQA